MNREQKAIRALSIRPWLLGFMYICRDTIQNGNPAEQRRQDKARLPNDCKELPATSSHVFSDIIGPLCLLSSSKTTSSRFILFSNFLKWGLLYQKVEA